MAWPPCKAFTNEVWLGVCLERFALFPWNPSKENSSRNFGKLKSLIAGFKNSCSGHRAVPVGVSNAPLAQHHIVHAAPDWENPFVVFEYECCGWDITRVSQSHGDVNGEREEGMVVAVAVAAGWFSAARVVFEPIPPYFLCSTSISRNGKVQHAS